MGRVTSYLPLWGRLFGTNFSPIFWFLGFDFNLFYVVSVSLNFFIFRFFGFIFWFFTFLFRASCGADERAPSPKTTN